MADDRGTGDDGDREELEEQAEAMRDGLSTIYGQISELAMEVDDYLAEYRYDDVEQAIESLAALVSGSEVEEAVDLARLRESLDGNERADGGASPDLQIPRLTEADLPAIAEPEGDDDYDEVAESLRDREGRCSDHIRRLFDAAEGWLERAITAAEAGRVAQVEELLGRREELSVELTSAYKLWELCLVDLYNDNPSNLGAVGDLIASMGAWLARGRSQTITS